MDWINGLIHDKANVVKMVESQWWVYACSL